MLQLVGADKYQAEMSPTIRLFTIKQPSQFDDFTPKNLTQPNSSVHSLHMKEIWFTAILSAENLHQSETGINLIHQKLVGDDDIK